MTWLVQGIDLVETGKVERIFRGRAGLLEAVFTAQERSDCQARRHPWRHFAAHFAAKEACLKVLGLGFDGAGIARVLRDVEVWCEADKPRILLHGWVARLVRRRPFCRWSVSLGQSSEYAIAMVVFLTHDSSADLQALAGGDVQ
jgi:phosphopantetheine--protein transferase-like protein